MEGDGEDVTRLVGKHFGKGGFFLGFRGQRVCGDRERRDVCEKLGLSNLPLCRGTVLNCVCVVRIIAGWGAGDGMMTNGRIHDRLLQDCRFLFPLCVLSRRWSFDANEVSSSSMSMEPHVGIVNVAGRRGQAGGGNLKIPLSFGNGSSTRLTEYTVGNA